MFAVYFWLKALIAQDKCECEEISKLFTEKNLIFDDIEFKEGKHEK